MVTLFKVKVSICSQEIFLMYRFLPGRGDALASCRPLCTRFIMCVKLSHQQGDVDNGVLQTQLYRFATV